MRQTESNIDTSRRKSLQEDMITHSIAGSRSLMVLSMGAGESLGYRLPDLAIDGGALVLRPLHKEYTSYVMVLQVGEKSEPHLGRCSNTLDVINVGPYA